MSIVIIKRMWLLVQIHLSTSNSGPFTYSRRLDIELGLHAPQSAPTSLEAPERGEVVAASAQPADHVADVAASEHMHVSISDPHLQFTPPTTVADETTFSPALAQGAQTANDQHPKVHAGIVQPIMTGSERLELRPAANGDV